MDCTDDEPARPESPASRAARPGLHAIVGGRATGKTTLLQTLFCALPAEAIVVLSDSPAAFREYPRARVLGSWKEYFELAGTTTETTCAAGDLQWGGGGCVEVPRRRGRRRGRGRPATLADVVAEVEGALPVGDVASIVVQYLLAEPLTLAAVHCLRGAGARVVRAELPGPGPRGRLRVHLDTSRVRVVVVELPWAGRRVRQDPELHRKLLFARHGQVAFWFVVHRPPELDRCLRAQLETCLVQEERPGAFAFAFASREDPDDPDSASYAWRAAVRGGQDQRRGLRLFSVQQLPRRT